MIVCRFVNTPGGCKHGEDCRFDHGSSGTGQVPGPENTPPTANKEQQLSSKISAPTPACRFFRRQNGCRYGEKCYFSHVEFGRDAPRGGSLYARFSVHKDAPLTLKNTGDEVSRKMGGALITFGKGARVQGVMPQRAETAQIQLHHVRLSWLKAQKTTIVDFKSVQHLETARRNLRTAKILDQKVNYSVSVDRAEKTRHNQIHIYDLDQSVTMRNIKDACGVQVTKVFLNDPYFNDNEDQVINEVLASARWICASDVKCDGVTWTKSKRGKLECNSILVLASMEDVNRILALDKQQLNLVGRPAPRLTHIYKIKMTTLSEIVGILEKNGPLHTFLKAYNGVRVVVYPPKGRFQAIHLQAKRFEDLVEPKRKLSELLCGRTAMSGAGVLWHKKLLGETGDAYLKIIMEDHSVYILRHRSSKLILYGRPENVSTAESLLINEVEKLKSDDRSLEVGTDVSTAAFYQIYRELISAFGLQAINASAFGDARQILIDGSVEDHSRAKLILEQVMARGESKQDENSGTRELTETSTGCPVCLVELEHGDDYSPPCGHLYHRDCLPALCTYTEDTAVKCVTCRDTIPLSDLAAILNQPEFESLLETSFRKHINAHPKKWRYCKTRGCDELFHFSKGKDEQAGLFRCNNCLGTFCNHCANHEHPGITCQQSDAANSEDPMYEKWKQENNTKDCPNCTRPIQKNGGCQHIECAMCKTHFCWVCLQVGKTTEEVHNHLSEKHGGIFDNEAVRQAREAPAQELIAAWRNAVRNLQEMRQQHLALDERQVARYLERIDGLREAAEGIDGAFLAEELEARREELDRYRAVALRELEALRQRRVNGGEEGV